MTATLEALPKVAKTLPAPAQQAWLAAYNADFAWRCSEAHAEKAAWRAVVQAFPEAASLASVKPAPAASAPSPAAGTVASSKPAAKKA